ncbi:type 2 isopentenyl-diphosphate Delta-isomerase [Falsirhodobacter xinxiangensis]|uniref:type 2 isopentenyl-diphosphate Delta-isomerase n=1 Tax=Falsirhodobacter xinxiangensis TaxID=2530049 RepID=UPI0010AAEF64|nr:type 2 isopentenyl-diphosphate Delta-isomerase [Rhodobacter xinxiangensis]
MISTRKAQHLNIVLEGRGSGDGRTGLDAVRFRHVALPELDFGAIDLSTRFLGRRIALPFMVSSMTGGTGQAATINRNLALACEALTIPLAVGSQRVALEGGEAGGLDAGLRALAPSVPILANFGAAQLNRGYGPDHARRAMDQIGADAVIVHLNPLQEALQPEGDRDWRGLLDRIGALAEAVPVVVKEVGAGISGDVARALADRGVTAIDVAGAGGTSWALVEAERAATPRQRAVAEAFGDWGIPTSLAIAEARAACPATPIIGSGGIADGLDAARAIRLGADLVGYAAAILPAATQSPEAVIEVFATFEGQLRTACFCTGSADLAALRNAALLP